MKGNSVISILLLFILLFTTTHVSAAQLAVNTSQSPTRQGEPLTISLTVANSDSTPLTNVELKLHYPDNLNSIYTQYITTGGAANSVSCSGDTTTTLCESGETVVWTIGAIPAGEGISVNMKPTVPTASYVDDGTIIEFDAELWVNGIQQQSITKSVTVQSQPFFELTVNDQFSPAPVSGQTEVVLNYSNMGTTSSGAVLTFPVPQGTTYISSTEEGSYNNGIVTWQLDSMTVGQDGEKRVILATNGTKGGLIESEPVTITETASGNNYQVQVATAGWFEDIQTPLMS
ncbi:MAG: hypothetical protein GY702_11245, partial [Desulfobulbaceae bacterium]|nr:hypothetical protein [Desulfobulbaceae bacterium]